MAQIVEAEAPVLTPLGPRPKEAADLMGVSVRTVWNLINSGELESTKVGGSRIVTRRSVERLIYGKAA